MATELVKAANRWSWTIASALAFTIGAILGQAEGLASVSDVSSALAMVVMAISLMNGKHAAISAFGLTAYIMYAFSTIDLYAVSIMIDLVVIALFVTLWRQSNAMQLSQRPQKTTPEKEARAEEAAQVIGADHG